MSKNGEVIENETTSVPATSGAFVNSNVAIKNVTLGGGLTIKEVKTVTRPLLSQVGDAPIYVRIDGEIHTSEIEGRKKKGEDKPDMEPANVCNVLNLMTGEDQQIIVNAALETGLTDAYKNKGYIGKCFAIASRLRPHDGGKKQIREYMVKEIVVEGLPPLAP